MGRRLNGDDPTTHSSIALLQERFRQLQRTKEMREERNLLRVMAAQSKVPNQSPTAGCHQSKWFLHPNLIHPSRPLIGSSSPPQLHCHIDHSMQFQDCQTSLFIGLRPLRGNNRMQSPKMSKETDVDTSLHL